MERLKLTWDIQGEDELISVSKEIVKLCFNGYDFLSSITFGISGDLGAGKTTLVRYLVQSLGIDAYVNSPSYVLMNEYIDSKADTLGSKNIDDLSSIRVEHWDLYRLQNPPEELVYAPLQPSLRLIEWIERDSGNDIELKYLIKIQIQDEASGSRKIALYEFQ